MCPTRPAASSIAEWHAVQPGTQAVHGRGRIPAGCEPRVGGARPGDEQFGGLVRRQRRHLVAVLCGKGERHATRGKHGKGGYARQQVRDDLARVHQLLQVIDHQEHLPASVEVGCQIGDVVGPGQGCSHGLGDRRRDQRRVSDRGEVDEPGGSARGPDVLGGGEREAGLADTSAACQRHQPGIAREQRQHLGELALPAHQRCCRRRQPQRRPPIARGSGQRRILLQDGSLQLPRLLGGLEPEPVEQLGTPRPQPLQRLDLAPGAVERECVLPLQRVPVGVPGDLRLQLGQELVVATAGEIGLQPQLERDQPLLAEVAGLGRDRFAGEVGERVVLPQVESRSQVGSAAGGVTRRELTAAAGQQALEPVEVELVVLDDQPIPGRHGLDAVGAERAAQAMDVDLQGVRRRCRRLLSPHRIHQPGPRGHPATPQQESRQEGALLDRPEVDVYPVPEDGHRPQNRKTKLHTPRDQAAIKPAVKPRPRWSHCTRQPAGNHTRGDPR